MDIAAKPRVWRDTHFDSQLEADWAISLERWGCEWRHHPGSLWTFGREWQPDFLLPGNDELGIADVILEVKGAHDERLDKASDVGRERNAAVMVGRQGLVPPGTTVENAGATWHNAIIGGHEFFGVATGSRLYFVTSEWLVSERWSGPVFASAERCLTDGRTMGLPMYKEP